MRKVEKKFVELVTDFKNNQQDMYVYDSKEEAIEHARRDFSYFTDKEAEQRSIDISVMHCVFDEDKDEWEPIREDDEEFEKDMSYPGSFDICFTIDKNGEDTFKEWGRNT